MQEKYPGQKELLLAGLKDTFVKSLMDELGITDNDLLCLGDIGNDVDNTIRENLGLEQKEVQPEQRELIGRLLLSTVEIAKKQAIYNIEHFIDYKDD